MNVIEAVKIANAVSVVNPEDLQKIQAQLDEAFPEFRWLITGNSMKVTSRLIAEKVRKHGLFTLQDEELAGVMISIHVDLCKSLAKHIGSDVQVPVPHLAYMLTSIMVGVLGDTIGIERKPDSVYTVIGEIVKVMPQVASNLATAIEISLAEEKKNLTPN